MAGVFGDYSQLFRLFHVINFVFVRFVSISSFASVIKRFVWRENPERVLQLKKKKFSHTSGEENSMFVAETASLLDLFPELSKEDTEVFKTSFHDFSVNCGIPIATILASKQENCRMCKKPLLLVFMQTVSGQVTGHLAAREFRHQPTRHQDFYSLY